MTSRGGGGLSCWARSRDAASSSATERPTPLGPPPASTSSSTLGRRAEKSKARRKDARHRGALWLINTRRLVRGRTVTHVHRVGPPSSVSFCPSPPWPPPRHPSPSLSLSSSFSFFFPSSLSFSPTTLAFRIASLSLSFSIFVPAAFHPRFFHPPSLVFFSFVFLRLFHHPRGLDPSQPRSRPLSLRNSVSLAGHRILFLVLALVLALRETRRVF